MITNFTTWNVAEAMELADHNFEVELQNIFTERNLLIPDKKAVIDIINNRYLGTVGNYYTPVQPKVLYDIAEKLLEGTADTDGYISGGISLHNNAVMGIKFTLGEREYIEGDKINLNFLMLTSFNGMYSICGHSTIERIINNSVCNTSKNVFSLRHTRFVANRIEVIKNMLKYYNRELQEFDEKMNGLVKHNMTVQQAVEWFMSLFPAPKTERATRNLEDNAGVFQAYMNEENAQLPGVRGTMYSAFQALISWINFARNVRVHNGRDRDEVRFESIHLGTGNKILQKGLEKLTMNFTFDEDDFLID